MIAMRGNTWHCVWAKPACVRASGTDARVLLGGLRDALSRRRRRQPGADATRERIPFMKEARPVWLYGGLVCSDMAVCQRKAQSGHEGCCEVQRA
jgi:hypothetical protein